MKYYLVSFLCKKGFGMSFFANEIELNICEAMDYIRKLTSSEQVAIIAINRISKKQFEQGSKEVK